MQTLRALYAAVIPDLGREEPLYLDDRRLTKTPFTQHIVVGWLWDLDGFGLDGLLGELLGAADQETLENIVWFLGSQYSDSSDAGQRADLWEKMDVYWQHRVEAARSLTINERSGELTRFCLWVRDTDVPLPAIEERLVFSIAHMEPGLQLYALLEGLTKRAASEPAAVSRVLRNVVYRWSTAPELAWSADKLEEALDSLCAVAVAGEDEAPAIEQIVLKLHQDANIDFTDKLTAAGSSG